MTQNELLSYRATQKGSFGGRPPIAIQGLSGAGEYPDNVFRIAHHVAHIVIPTNPDGFTIDPATLRMPAFPKSVFLVSRKDCEQKFDTRPGLEEVADWIRQNRDLLSRQGHYIGGWWDEGIFFLDITLPIQGMRAALNAAYTNRQKALYHPSSGNLYYLPEAA